MGSIQLTGNKLVAVLAIAGLLSGLLADCGPSLGGALPGVLGEFIGLGFGGIFGATVAVCLVRFGVFDSWQAAVFCGLAVAAFWLSQIAAFLVEEALHTPGLPEISAYPAWLFAGGAVGGSLLLGGAAFLLTPKSQVRALVSRLPRWSALGAAAGGTLGMLSWVLAPSLGTAIWRALYAVHLPYVARSVPPAPPADRSRFLMSSITYALWPVWQTGMAFALGILVQRLRPEAQREEMGQL